MTFKIKNNQFYRELSFAKFNHMVELFSPIEVHVKVKLE